MKRLFVILATLFVAASAIGIGLLAGGHLGYHAFVIRTGSMKPTMPPQSLVIVRTGEYKVGQVASFVKNGAVVSHRLIAQHPDGSFTTKGDANLTADVSPIEPGHIIGGVVSHVDRLGFWVVYLRNPLTPRQPGDARCLPSGPCFRCSSAHRYRRANLTPGPRRLRWFDPSTRWRLDHPFSWLLDSDDSGRTEVAASGPEQRQLSGAGAGPGGSCGSRPAKAPAPEGGPNRAATHRQPSRR